MVMVAAVAVAAAAAAVAPLWKYCCFYDNNVTMCSRIMQPAPFNYRSQIKSLAKNQELYNTRPLYSNGN
jgi:hypothetical protein